MHVIITASIIKIIILSAPLAHTGVFEDCKLIWIPRRHLLPTSTATTSDLMGGNVLDREVF